MAKAGRPKNLRPHQVRLHVPLDANAMLKNKAKRIYWALQEYEKKMAKDVTSVRMKDYTDLLDAYQQVCNDLRAKGYKGRYAEKRVDEQGMVQDKSARNTSEVSGNGQTSVGAGIQAVNPLTEQR